MWKAKASRQQERRFLSPADVLLLTLLFLIVLQASAALFLSVQPWTGLRLEADYSTNFLKVKSVAKNSPAEGVVSAGEILTALEFRQNVIPLTTSVYSYPFMSKTHRDYHEYLDSQTALRQALVSGETFVLVNNAGKRFRLAAMPHTPLDALPMDFWFFSILFVVIPMIGVMVWSRKPYSREATLLLIASVAHYCLYLLATTYIAKDFSLGGNAEHLVAVGHLVFMNTFIPCVFALMASHPNRLLSDRILYGFTAISAFFPLNLYFSLVDTPPSNFFYQSLPSFITCLIISQIQVVKSKTEPLKRAAARIMQASLLLPYVPVFLLFLIPLTIGMNPFIDHRLPQVAAILVFAGLAIGILRFQLFDVEYWWFKSWLWLLGGLLVVLLDIVLVTLFYTPQVYALGLSVIMAGFLYFPLRQWLLGKLMPLDSQSVQDFLPTFSKLMSGAVSSEEFEERWQAVLQKRFRPLHLDVPPDEAEKPALSENGLYLSVPTLNGTGGYRLTGKQMASRLFSKADVRAVASLLGIARIASNASATRKQAVLTERRRVMHDLHDTIGARLLSLSHEITSPQHRKATQDTLQLLRDMIHLTLQKTPYLLEEHLADWRAETVELVEAAGASLRWQVDQSLESLILPPVQIVELMLFVRESTGLALKTPGLETLEVRFTSAGERLHVSIFDNGALLAEQNVTPGVFDYTSETSRTLLI